MDSRTAQSSFSRRVSWQLEGSPATGIGGKGNSCLLSSPLPVEAAICRSSVDQQARGLSLAETILDTAGNLVMTAGFFICSRRLRVSVWWIRPRVSVSSRPCCRCTGWDSGFIPTLVPTAPHTSCTSVIYAPSTKQRHNILNIYCVWAASHQPPEPETQ